MSNLFMRFPNGCNKALTLSYDDGLEQDIHLMAVLKPYGIKATFNLNSGLMPPEGTVFPPTRFDRVMPPRQAKAAYSGTPHEVAVHGNQHPFLDQLPQAQVTYDLLKDRLRLEALFDTTVNGMAYPYGKHTPAVTAAARAAGIVYSRTIENTHWYGLPENWLQWHPTCHHDDPDLMPLAEEFVRGRPNDAPWLFYLWGHTFEFDCNQNWSVIEDFCRTVGNQPHIFYATNKEIYTYIEAYRRLEFDTAMSRVTNPSSIPLWFDLDGVLYRVGGGETCRLRERTEGV